MDKQSFVFYTEWLEFLEDLTAEDFRAVVEAICSLCEKGEEPTNLSPSAKVAFKCIRKTVERNNEKYEEIKRKRSEAGRIGANKRWQNIANDSNDGNCHNSDGKAWQSIANMADNDNVNVTLYNESNKPTSEEVGMSHSPKVERDAPHPARETFDAKKFLAFFNEAMDKANANIPRLRILQGTRLELVRARVNQYSKREVFEVVNKAAVSDFLNGRAGRDPKPRGIDWIMLPNNFPKVLEGNYDNRENNLNNGTSEQAARQTDRRGTKADNSPAKEYADHF